MYVCMYVMFEMRILPEFLILNVFDNNKIIQSISTYCVSR